MSTIIYLVRHAEVENPEGVEYMRLPGFGLSEYGREQAIKIGKILRSKGVDRIYSSPLKRTKETARIIADRGIPIRYSEDLLEADYRKWQGLQRTQRPIDQVRGYDKDPVKYSAILGESLLEIQHRVTDEIIRAVERHPGERIAVVTHAAPVIAARLFFENRSLMDFNKIVVSFASVTTVVFDDRMRCKRISYNEFVAQREDAIDINER